MEWSAAGVTIAHDGVDDPKATVMLAHGAGGNMNQKTVLSLRDAIQAAGASVVRFNFLYKELGRGLPDRMPVLMETYAEVADSVREVLNPARLIIGGHSMGGRAASMLAAEGANADALLLFAYPLHPAGKPEKLRDAHLPNIHMPTLCFNGTQDELCTPALMEEVLKRCDAKAWIMHWLEHADHSYHVRRESGRKDSEVFAEITETVRTWLTGPAS